MTSLPDAYAEEWLRYLEGELAQQRQLVAVGQALTRAVVDRQDGEVTRLTEHQQELLAAGAARQRRRDALVHSAARHLGLAASELKADRLAACLPARLAGLFEDLRRQLRQVVEELHRVNDRNQLLLRTGLAVVGDCLSVVAGPVQGDGYDRRGSAEPRRRRAGGMLDWQA